jgi:predicted DNA-binding protein (MmcQ/YjbR family)
VIERIRTVCLALPDTTEDVKWGNDLVFSVLGKMFAVVCLEPPHTVAFKCSPEDQAELVEREGIIPAPYLARYFWVQLAEPSVLGWRELEQRLRASHELVRAKAGKGSRARSANTKVTKRTTKVAKGRT